MLEHDLKYFSFTENEEWQPEEEGCNPDLEPNIVGGVFKAKVRISIKKCLVCILKVTDKIKHSKLMRNVIKLYKAN